MFSRDGDIREFPFSRSKEDMIKFANTMNAPAVQRCDTYDDALRLVSSDSGIVFVVHHPNIPSAGEASVEKQLASQHTTQVFGQAARMNQAFAKFCITSSTADLSKFGLAEEAPKDGFISKLEAGGVPPVILEGSSDLTSTQVLDFIKENNVPLVATLGPHNFNKIGRNGKPLVIGAVDGSQELQVKEMKQNLMAYAIHGPKAIVDKYYFGWIDGKQWNKFLTQFNITTDDLPQVVVLDVPTKTYWHDESYNTNIADFIKAVDDGTVQPQEAGHSKGRFEESFNRFLDVFHRYFPWSLAVMVAVIVLLILLVLPAPEELRPPYPRQEQTPATSKASEETKQEGTASDETTSDETKKDK